MDGLKEEVKEIKGMLELLVDLSLRCMMERRQSQWVHLKRPKKRGRGRRNKSMVEESSRSSKKILSLRGEPKSWGAVDWAESIVSRWSNCVGQANSKNTDRCFLTPPTIHWKHLPILRNCPRSGRLIYSVDFTQSISPQDSSMLTWRS